MASELLDKLRALEDASGRFIASAEIDEAGELSNIVWASYGPGDLMLNVWNCSISLCRAVRGGSGYSLESVLADDDQDKARVVHWLDSALRAAGGWINLSGHYPFVKPMPEWLAVMIRKHAETTAG